MVKIRPLSLLFSYIRKKWFTIFIIMMAIVLFVCIGTMYIYSVRNGYIWLNNPSRQRYPIAGVDLSHYQGKVDWATLSGQNIQFAYVKATEGSNHVDKCFSYNWEQSGKTSLKVGAYHFFSFDSPGQTQAANFINCVGNRKGMLPPAIDVEYYGDKKSNPPDPQAVQQQLQAMLDQVEEHYQMVPVIYSTEGVWEKYLKGRFDRYPLWIRNVFTSPRVPKAWTFWQYTNRAKLEGYQGNEKFIDLNVFYGDEDAWKAWSEPK